MRITRNLKNKLLFRLNKRLCKDALISGIELTITSRPREKKLTLFDIGANVGQGIKKMNTFRKEGYNCEFIGFEMVPSTFKVLKQTADKYKYINSSLFDVGLSNNSTRTKIFEAPETGWNSLNNSDAYRKRDGNEIEVELKVFDDLVNIKTKQGLWIAKIDVEGHELEVIDGMSENLANGSIDTLIVELGFNPEDKQHTYFPAVEERLRKFNYRCADICEITKYKHPDWKNNYGIGYANVIYMRDREHENT